MYFFFKPRLHERFFACDGDAIFFEIVASPARGENRLCSHSLTKSVILSQKFQLIEFLTIFFPAIFSSVASPVRGWLHMRFSPRAGDATIFKKIASPSQAKNRSCSRGFKDVRAKNFYNTDFFHTLATVRY